MPGKRYLGDSVYVELVRDGHVRLTTDNGAGPSNAIYLDDGVRRELARWLDELKIERRRG